HGARDAPRSADAAVGLRRRRGGPRGGRAVVRIEPECAAQPEAGLSRGRARDPGGSILIDPIVTLTGPGGSFEIVTESVRGVPMQVYKSRLGTMRELIAVAESHGDKDRKSTRLNSSHVAISYAV